MLDKLTESARKEPTSWDDTRERRVLNGALVLGRDLRARDQRRRVLARAACAVFAAAAAVALVFGLRAAQAPVARVAVGARNTASAERKLALADGSSATLSADAEALVVEQSAARVRVTQRKGVARYDVHHDPARAFVVTAGDVVVQVRGTAFTVEVRDDWVEVRVERGRVEVSDGTRTTTLVKDEALRVREYDVHANDAAAPSEPPVTPKVEAIAEPRAEAGQSVAAPVANTAARPSALAGSADALFDQANAARSSGRLADAAAKLRAFTKRYPLDARVATALFMLGRVERGLGHHAQAAEVFARCAKLSTRGTLAEDAMAEQAESLRAAGNLEVARDVARAYSRRYPRGVHLQAMRALAN